MIKWFIRSTDTILELAAGYLAVILLSATCYSLFEGKPFGLGVWWALVTAMTVGYGDTYPLTVGGRVVGIILMHIVPLVFIPLVTARMAAKLIVNSDVFSHDEQEQIKTDLQAIKRLLEED